MLCRAVLLQALFPDNTYSNDSGGDPTVIPELTFEQFQVSNAAETLAVVVGSLAGSSLQAGRVADVAVFSCLQHSRTLCLH